MSLIPHHTSDPVCAYCEKLIDDNLDSLPFLRELFFYQKSLQPLWHIETISPRGVLLFTIDEAGKTDERTCVGAPHS